MGNDLSWLPPPEEREEHGICHIQWELSKYLDPNWNGGGYTEMVGREIIPFLKGLISGYQKNPARPNDFDGPHRSIEDAQSLIDAIEKYGKVELSMHS